MSVRALAYAKINLSLRVIGVRPDGYHEIVSDVQTIDLSDRLTVDLDGNGVHIDNDLVMRGQDLVERATAELRARKECASGVRIEVRKSIPAGAGLGGGSSDAAAVLNVLDQLTPPSLPFKALCAVGAAIGSDVPLFLYGGRLRIRGRGERVERLSTASPSKRFVVVVPSSRCDTAAIYARWDEIAKRKGAARRNDSARGENDLLRPALDVHPELVEYHEAVGSFESDCHGMSGSGSSFYVAFEDPQIAERAYAELMQRFASASVFICRPTDAGHRIEEST